MKGGPGWLAALVPAFAAARATAISSSTTPRTRWSTSKWAIAPPGDSASYPDDDLQAQLVDGKWQFSHKDGTPY